ncbi:glycosyltransferase family 39 protein, partial [Candidatus Azambacteria bacterium]|nr:glycosyltransferase family 39 protein [Candidatus Azambacteria bacterium]
MTPKIANWIAGILLGVMFVLMVTSAKGDSATMDEVAHIPAGYSYLTQKDMRLNPEHPPLLKDLAAIPLLFQNINFPSDFKAWKDDINGQWDFGFQFLYRSGNDADNIIFWARIPFILLTLLLGYFIFKWGKELFGPGPALLALGLYTFSPTFLAHGRLVTTDVGASFGFFIRVYYFVKALRVPSTKHIITAGIALGIALLIKFSTFLLVPLLVFLAFLWWWMRRREGLATSSKRTIGVLLF